MVSTDQDSGAEVNINNEGHIKCSQFDIETDATNIAFTSFLLDTVDDASAKSAISNTIKNNLSNTATQAGGGYVNYSKYNNFYNFYIYCLYYWW